MEKRTLGKSSVKIAPLVFGGNIFRWTADEATSFKLLDAFVDAGFNCVDTADSYSFWVPGNKGGDSEEVIGNWFAQGGGRREKVVIATKIGHLPGKAGLKRDNITSGVDAALKRLKTDRIDLFQSHMDDKDIPLEEPLEAYQSLIKAGKIRVIGASNFEADRFSQALDVAEKNGLPRYETLQNMYNLYARYPFEDGLAQICAKRGVAALPYYALAAGFLTGKYRSPKDTEGKARSHSVAEYFNPRGMGILKALDEVAAAHSAKPGQVAVAWLMAQPNISPIASATNLDQLKELIGATRLKLSAADMAKLNEASDPVKKAA